MSVSPNPPHGPTAGEGAALVARKPGVRRLRRTFLVSVTVFAVTLTALAVIRLRFPGPGKLVPSLSNSREVGVAHPESVSQADWRSVFEYTNVGRSPVRILRTTSSCGCASVNVDPERVAPGATTRVTIDAMPLDTGIRKAKITLETDSTVTPRLTLEVEIVGNRLPPYVFRAGGELLYREGYSQDETRRIYVETVQAIGSPTVKPILSCDLPFVKTDLAEVKELPHIGGPQWIVHGFWYKASFEGAPPRDPFTGWVSVTSPWDPADVTRIRVEGEENHPFQVSPKRLVLQESARGGAIARLTVLARQPGLDIQVKPRPDAADSLSVTRLPSTPESDEFEFEVRAAHGYENRNIIHGVIVSSAHRGGDTILVPVRMASGVLP